MKKVGLAIQCDIVNDYYLGMKYKDIMAKYGVNRWNIQDALSKFDFKTDRIKSPPRLPGGKKKGTLMERYHDGDYLPPLSCYPNKQDEKPLLEDDLDGKCGEELFREQYVNEFVPKDPVLEGDLDIMEKMDLDDTEDFPRQEYMEIDVSEDDEVRYIKR